MSLEHYIILAGVFFFLFTVFFWFLQNKIGGTVDSERSSSFIRLVKSAFFSKIHLSAYPILLILLAIYFGSQFKIFNKTSPIKKNHGTNELFKPNQFGKNLIETLKYANQLYLSVEDYSVRDTLYKVHWKNMINIKEAIVKFDFDSKPESVEKNFTVTNWESERFIDGGSFESITKIEISDKKHTSLKFKLWLGNRLLAECDSTIRNIEIYAKPPNKGDNLEDANNYGRKIEYQSKLSTNLEIVLLLKQEDFSDDHSSVITIITQNKQSVPYSMSSEFTSRYKLGIDHFKIISHYRSELSEYKLGWYHPEQREISWMDKLVNVKVRETEGKWGIENKQQPIVKKWTYSIDLSSGLERNLLFQYRQAPDRLCKLTERTPI